MAGQPDLKSEGMIKLEPFVDGHLGDKVEMIDRFLSKGSLQFSC